MLKPETLMRAYRGLKTRKPKAAAVQAMRMLGLRYMVVRMDTINLCNLRCKMCYYSSDWRRKKDEMDPPLFRKIADEIFGKTRFLYLSCATEPLMNKHFAEFIAMTSEYKVPFTSFCTNGQLLTDEVVRACIESKISEIVFSIDGATAETYEHIRRGGKWDRLLRSLELLASTKRAMGSRLPETRINFTSMNHNIRELPAMVDFAADHGARSLHVRHLLAYTDEANSCKEEMKYLKVFNDIAEGAKTAAVRRNIVLFLPERVPERAVGGKSCVTDPSTIKRTEANAYCMLPWCQAIINWKGDYRICSAHTMGNFQSQSFDEIYNSAKMREIRRRMLWRTADSCSWDCHQEAYDVPEEDEEQAPVELPVG
jgi:MoaA/NifB/PqqE/SkfB family radical SAM enzyme